MVRSKFKAGYTKPLICFNCDKPIKAHVKGNCEKSARVKHLTELAMSCLATDKQFDELKELTNG